MTEEQIKQNAEDYINENTQGVVIDANIRNFLLDVYLAGAHSIDEEIKELKEEIESLQEQYNTCFDGFTKRGAKLGELMKENVKLRNSWISVEDRLPEKLENDCASYYVLTRIDGPRQIWYMVNRYNYDIKSWEGCNNNTTHWMPITELKKGE